MRLSSAIIAFSSAFVAADKDQFHYSRPGMINGPSMWIFGTTGLNIFSPDGTEQIKSTPPEEICHQVAGDHNGDPALSCEFYDVVSDGKKYVWAAVSRGVSKIDVFDIDTGTTVGSFETCPTPTDLEYHPLRDEIWVRCSGVADETGGYIDVFSAASPSADTFASVDRTGNSTLSADGCSIIDSSLGDVGYVTVRDQPTLYKIDLSERIVVDSFELEQAYGVSSVAYSMLNRHVYVRASVCCTCGFDDSDLGESCPDGQSDVNITTGDLAGTVAPGQCGGCEGVDGVDTIGVYEFDTSTDTFLGKHVMPDDTGGEPFASPDGGHIVLVGHNGGNIIRILEAGQPGKVSAVAYDLALGFLITGQEDDFAFVQTTSDDGMGDGKDRDLIVIASGTENKVALIDISHTPQVNTITLDNDLTTAGSSHQVEWVVGTPYVWIDGTGGEEIYVLNVDNGFVEKITNLTATKMLSVENYAAKRTAALISQQILAAMADLPIADTAIKSNDDEDKSGTDDENKSNNDENKSGTEDDDKSNDDGMKSGSDDTLDGKAKIDHFHEQEDDNDIDPIGITALAVGLCALAASLGNMVYRPMPKSGDDRDVNDAFPLVEPDSLT